MNDVVSYKDPGTPISYSDILKAVRLLEGSRPPNRLYFFTRGTGMPDAYAIKYWDGSNIVVVDTNGEFWLNGEKVNEEDL